MGRGGGGGAVRVLGFWSGGGELGKTGSNGGGGGCRGGDGSCGGASGATAEAAEGGEVAWGFCVSRRHGEKGLQALSCDRKSPKCEGVGLEGLCLWFLTALTWQSCATVCRWPGLLQLHSSAQHKHRLRGQQQPQRQHKELLRKLTAADSRNLPSPTSHHLLPQPHGHSAHTPPPELRGSFTPHVLRLSLSSFLGHCVQLAEASQQRAGEGAAARSIHT